MKKKVWAIAAAGVAVAGGIVTIVACSSSSVPPPPVSASQCSTSPGQFPSPSCVPYAPDAQSCVSPTQACNTAPCTSGSPCLAMADNSGASTANLRIRKLNVTAPPVLASEFIQNLVINDGINLDNYCGEDGDGLFSWLMQIDTANKTVTTGGAPPVADPFTTGYCFVNGTVTGLQVGPTMTTYTLNSDGSLTTAVIPNLLVPIYAPGADGGPSNTAIILPLSNVQVKNVTLSESNNCIGNYNPDSVVSDGGACKDFDDNTCERWTTAGSLAGFITLKQANTVLVPQEGESLCVLLTNSQSIDPNSPMGFTKCETDSSGNVMATGDFCSTTMTAGGCADSDWLAATFAASAVKIVAPNQPACMGQIQGGDDGGAGPDSGSTDAAKGDGASPSDASGQ
jgi:hypothetical protein